MPHREGKKTYDFKISLAGLTVSVRSRYALAAELCRRYYTDAEQVDFAVEATEEDIARLTEQASPPEADYAEFIELYRAIAERLPAYDRMVIHGAAITYKGRAYLFLAPSGTGKSTHIRLWWKLLGNTVDIVNGDKPILDCSGKEPFVCGTPWTGKERWGKPVVAPLAGICLLRRGECDAIERIAPGADARGVLQQIYRPHSEAMLTKTLALTDAVLKRVPLYRLTCTPTLTAVRTAFPVLTGETCEEREHL